MNVSPAGISAGLWALVREHAITRRRRLGDAVFAEIDGFAWVQGWEISRLGTGHRYRDPRFDRVAACRTCGGSGKGECGGACRTCKGDGLLNFVEAPAARHRV
ncbi:hypothetical protein Sru01_01840 [Sphaerisporangium rufum]|uniref:Uncharacterized protein n=1 Tax=Sphaerisporangium rufum TaxID=1381558 RepID=A0A919R1H0_9ACTN|nr:hypothetical protein [Sphaerisporangium rufum]GII75202.1 hypothetical protein Sru01_01840 [Sphaerisporangium rufum]